MSTVGLYLEALDVLFFRDGRPFNASSRTASGLAMPQTVAGALRTALLQKYACDFAALRGGGDFGAAVAKAFPDRAWIGQVACRGPWFAKPGSTPAALEVFVPVPATLHERKKEMSDHLYRLKPLRTPLPNWAGPLRPLWLAKPFATEPAVGYLGPAGLRAFLKGEVVPSTAIEEPKALFALDHRTGIGIHPDRLSAEESIIYGASFLALKEGVGLYAEAVLPADAPRDALLGLNVLALGGEGRRARLNVLPHAFAWPNAGPTSGQKPLLLLTTPGLFAERWRPRELSNLVAAAVPSPLAVSGWDLARNGPKPTRFAAPAGSVYFLDGPAPGLLDSLADLSEDRQQGWGCYLKGAWKDE